MHSCCYCDNKNKIIRFYQHLYLNQEAEMTYKFKVKLVDISQKEMMDVAVLFSFLGIPACGVRC